ncbi:hypothetical protein [Paenibacillus tianjinensis]|uniref:Uncharacterized protein n=1 Tax=Paenibacillus tianjinensis TaxID=2810347 RepID=A0ABX7LAM2_9BACL|nr:hypothetical protein [Paenibacillus tianjinensis]QSF43495.1 hypothetical protein JRJ22_19725 [Paenibacillus tianjinensis]
MKLRLLERNYWSDYDCWIGRKSGFRIEISTPYRVSHNDLGKFSYIVKESNKIIKSSVMDDKLFSTLDECKEFLEDWIKKAK